ncbi:hypothetical protein BLOT_007398 [Blomia tropicalis]|nr:hypothetical protein BLOT_007398 [Blomia tropicalis]
MAPNTKVPLLGGPIYCYFSVTTFKLVTASNRKNSPAYNPAEVVDLIKLTPSPSSFLPITMIGSSKHVDPSIVIADNCFHLSD